MQRRSVYLADKPLLTQAPRACAVDAGRQAALRPYHALQMPQQMRGLLLCVMKGIAPCNCEACAEAIPVAFECHARPYRGAT